jgi:hypothetical protein
MNGWVALGQLMLSEFECAESPCNAQLCPNVKVEIEIIIRA